MNDFLKTIKGSEKIIDWFGYWIDFHDAEIHWIKFSRGGVLLQGNTFIDIGIVIWQNSKKHGHPSFVHFHFAHCASIDLSEFNQQNQLSNIQFALEDQLNAGKILPDGSTLIPQTAVIYTENNQQYLAKQYLKVTFHPEFGVGGSFACYSAEMKNIQACDDYGNIVER